MVFKKVQKNTILSIDFNLFKKYLPTLLIPTLQYYKGNKNG